MLQKILQPYWLGHEMVEESILPLADAQGDIAPIALLYPVTEVHCVQSATLDTLYHPGIDYRIEDGLLVIPRTSAIPRMTMETYRPSQQLPGQTFRHADGNGWIAFHEGHFFHAHQTVISYHHDAPWTGYVPPCKQHLLPRTARMLAEKQDFRLLFYGDSITTGANASMRTHIEPFQPDWCTLVARQLEHHHQHPEITVFNTAMGGKDSAWGLLEVDARAAQLHPDLVVLAFGMNDGSARRPAAEFSAHTAAIMAAIRRENPSCEFLLVASMLPNREVDGFFGMQPDYAPALLAMETEGICVADMMHVHQSLLARKSYRDMTGNNVNHPNDFLIRIYAQVLLATMGASPMA
ncbi:MAG: SGNH/GDSL hydrolase family protein [Clostridia bacterium]